MKPVTFQEIDTLRDYLSTAIKQERIVNKLVDLATLFFNVHAILDQPTHLTMDLEYGHAYVRLTNRRMAAIADLMDYDIAKDSLRFLGSRNESALRYGYNTAKLDHLAHLAIHRTMVNKI